MNEIFETSTECIYIIYMTIVLLCKLSFIRVSSVIEELLHFDCLFNDFCRPSP